MAYPANGARTTYLGTENTGDVLTKANFDKSPGGLAAYAQLTANSAALSGFTGIGIAANCPATANRIYLITIGAAGFSLAGSGGQTTDYCIYDASTAQSITSTIVANNLSVSNQPGATVCAYHEPTGSNQYQPVIALVNNSGANTIAVLATASGSAARTAYILIEDVGPAF